MDNIRFTEAQIKICFLLSLNKPSAFIRATNGKYKIFKNDVLVNNATVIYIIFL